MNTLITPPTFVKSSDKFKVEDFSSSSDSCGPIILTEEISSDDESCGPFNLIDSAEECKQYVNPIILTMDVSPIVSEAQVHPSCSTLEEDLRCEESLDDISPMPLPPTQRINLQDCLDALMGRRKRVNNINMLAENYISSDFSEWVSNVWQLVSMCGLDDNVAYNAIRMFGLVLASIQEQQAWPLLKWERYACIWIAIKLEDSDSCLSQSAEIFCSHITGTGGMFRSEQKALLKAEQRVLMINDFTLSFPHASDFVGILLQMIGCSESTRHSILKLLKRTSYKSKFVSVDPLLLAVACIHSFLPYKWETIFRRDEVSKLDEFSNLIEQISQ
jgi:hypothetical protein